MLSSEKINLPTPLTVVCHDAGAANLIIGWLRERSDIEVRPCMQGPALQLWSKAFPGMKSMELSDALSGSSGLLSGTGWASDLEHIARKFARESGLFSIAVIDHWVNYRMRFIRNGETVMPDELWVSDDEAELIASEQFPDATIRKFPNLYLERLIEEIRSYQAVHENNSISKRILYVLEPIHSRWRNDDKPGEFQALEYFINHLTNLDAGTSPEIILRPHPSEEPDKYDKWCAGQKNNVVKVDTTHTLSEMIAWADWVVGCESFALVAALYAGKYVMSTMPPWAPHCRLPHKAIVHLRDISG